MIAASDIKLNNVIRMDGKICKVVSKEIKGTAKSAKMIHLKLKSLEDGHTIEKSIKADDKVEDLEMTHVKMQFSYKEGSDFMFMNMSDYEQFTIPGTVVGEQEVFLKENDEIDVLFVEGKALSIAFPETAELIVSNTPPGTKGANDSTFKEAELENGVKTLVPQFVKEGDRIKISTSDFTYLERLTDKKNK